MNRLALERKRRRADGVGYGDADQLIRAHLARHPDSTALHIEMATGLPVATINWLLAKYAVGSHEEPRYERSGWGPGPLENSRPGQLWRLAAEPQGAALRRLKWAFEKIARVLAEHPQLAGEVVVRAMELAKAAERRADPATRPAGRRAKR